jgi:hypothetical protein
MFDEIGERLSSLDYKMAFYDDYGPSRAFIIANSIKGVNTEENPERLYASGLWHIMRHGNFRKRISDSNDDDIHPDFVDFIIKTALFHRSIENQNDDSVTHAITKKNTYATNNEAILKIRDVIFNAWANIRSDPLKKDAIDFYNAFIMLLHKTNGDTWNKVESPNAILGENTDYRINFNKVNINGTFSTKLVFAETLPYIPIGKKVFVRCAENEYISITIDESNKDIIKQIYYAIFYNKMDATIIKTINDKLGDKFVNLIKDYKNYPNKKGFDLVPEKMVQSFLKKNVESLIKTASSTTTKKPFDEVIDMVTGLVFYRKEDGQLYRTVDGKEINYSNEESYKESKCFVSRDYCNIDVVSCLIGVDVDITTCARILKNQNIFDVATSEISKMHPDIAIILLKKFKFTILNEDSKTGMELIIPQNFNEWKTSGFLKFDTTFQKILNDNTKLMEYLKYIVQYIRDNPAILNKNFIKTSPSLPAFTKGTRLSWTMNPNRITAFSESARTMRAWVPAPLLPVLPTLHSTNAHMLFTPMINMSAYTFSPMIGGVVNGYEIEDYIQKSNEGRRSNAYNFRKMIATVLNEMKNDNIVIDENDIAGIDNALNELEKMEKKLVLLIVIITLYNSIDEILTENERAIGNIKLSEMIDDVENSFTLAYETKKIIGVLNNNYDLYNKISVQLGGSVYPALVDILISRSTSAHISQKKYK